MFIPNRDELTRVVQEMARDVEEIYESTEDGQTPNLGMSYFTNLDEESDGPGKYVYSFQIAIICEEPTPAAVNLGHIDYPCFQDAEFAQEILSRYQDHVDKDGCVCVMNLTPSEAANMAVDLIEEYQRFLEQR
jgi:hypothetical protein